MNLNDVNVWKHNIFRKTTLTRVSTSYKTEQMRLYDSTHPIH